MIVYILNLKAHLHIFTLNQLNSLCETETKYKEVICSLHKIFIIICYSFLYNENHKYVTNL